MRNRLWKEEQEVARKQYFRVLEDEENKGIKRQTVEFVVKFVIAIYNSKEMEEEKMRKEKRKKREKEEEEKFNSRVETKEINKKMNKSSQEINMTNSAKILEKGDKREKAKGLVDTFIHQEMTEAPQEQIFTEVGHDRGNVCNR